MQAPAPSDARLPEEHDGRREGHSAPVLAAWLIRVSREPLRACACVAGSALGEEAVQHVRWMRQTASTRWSTWRARTRRVTALIVSPAVRFRLA